MGERSSNFRDIHLHKKANNYGREIKLGWERDLATQGYTSS